MHDAFERLYSERLDSWVKDKGPLNLIDTDLVGSCEKLTLVNAGPIGLMKLLADWGEYDFRVDVCVNIAANRIYPQPKLSDPETAAMICRDPLFQRMCQRAGLK